MAKKGVYKITGNRKPYTGNKTLYQVAEWYPSTPLSSRKESRVIWELFKKNKDGKFETTGIKKRGIGEFTFGKKSHFFTFKIEGYLHSPEGKEPMALIVQPQQNKEQQSKEKDITGVKITYQDGSRVTKPLSYRDRLRAIAQCRNLEGEYINFGLWEDTEKGNGHNKKNQLIMTSPPIMVDSRGYARWNFSLLPTFITLSHKKEDDKKPQEYYVTAEYNGKMQASDNLNANNQEYKIPPLNKKPQPKPETPKGSTNPNSANNKPDQKGNITRIKLVDKNGKAFSKKPKFGETIKLIIEGKDLIGKKYTLKLWEHDNTGDNDLVYNHTHVFKANKQEVLITLTDEMRKIGELGKDQKNPDNGEYWTGRWQEIFAEVIFLSISTKSQIIDVGLMEKPKLINIGRSPAKKEESETGKTTCVCKEQYKDLVWGAKVDCEFRKKVVQICAELWGESRKMEMANGLMAVINVETGGSFKAHQIMGKPLVDLNFITKEDFWQITKDKKTGKIISRTSRAVGLIQFTQDALQAIGEFTKGSGFDKLHEVKLRFARMGENNQLDYVKKYFYPKRNFIKSPQDIYLAVFAPIGVGKDDHYPLYKKGTIEYIQNESVDTKSKGIYKNDGKIQRSEILERYNSSFNNGNGINKPKIFNCNKVISNSKETHTCLEDYSQCFEYSDVIDNPKLNNQSDNVNKNRFHRTPRYNNKYPKGYYHTGTDILMPLNTELKSMLCGEVVEALDTRGDLGKIVTIKSKDKNGKFIWIRYCHLDSYSVLKGQKIKHGKIFGKSGNTGNAKSILPQYYHVHIEASTDGVFYGGNTRVDPEQFMKTKFDETIKGNSIN